MAQGAPGALQRDPPGRRLRRVRRGLPGRQGARSGLQRARATEFKEAHDAEPDRPEPKWALLAYLRLFEIEREARERALDSAARLELRQARSAPLVAELYAWLEQLPPQLVPSDPLQKAVQYALNQREALTRFVADGRVEIDNNRFERSLRQVAVGRKNYLFAGSVDGAKWAATAYTSIMSCNELGVPLREYLVDVLERVSTPRRAGRRAHAARLARRSRDRRGCRHVARTERPARPPIRARVARVAAACTSGSGRGGRAGGPRRGSQPWLRAPPCTSSDAYAPHTLRGTRAAGRGACFAGCLASCCSPPPRCWARGARWWRPGCSRSRRPGGR